MMRGAIKNTSKGEAYFRWRSPDVSRIENLSDIIFALALALIAAPDVPKTFAELAAIWRDILATGVCFAILLVIWNTHYVFFRRYDLMDGHTVFLNSVLLFLVFSLAYPLKYIILFVVRLMTLDFSSGLEIDAVMSLEEGKIAMILYSAAYASVFIVFTLLYHHALADADRMALTAHERILTRSAIEGAIVHVITALGICAIAFFTPPEIAVTMGFLFFLIFPGMMIVTYREKKRITSLESGETSPAEN